MGLLDLVRRKPKAIRTAKEMYDVLGEVIDRLSPEVTWEQAASASTAFAACCLRSVTDSREFAIKVFTDAWDETEKAIKAAGMNVPSALLRRDPEECDDTGLQARCVNNE